MKHIRPAATGDLARIAEILIFNYRLNFYPIFRNDEFYFGEMQVPALAAAYESDLVSLYVYDDGVVKGFLQLDGSEVKKLFVEPALQGNGIGSALLRYAVETHGANTLWALEKNARAIRFYQRHGFRVTAERMPEDGTQEYLVRLERKANATPDSLKIKRLLPEQLHCLSALFDYNDVPQMIAECTREIQNGTIDIFVLYVNGVLTGELHVRYESDDARFALRGRRAYLFAFRVRHDLQNRGFGSYLLKTVLATLQEEGYREFTVGVEDDNLRALHIYQTHGFDRLVLRKQESYQGDAYEYNLYLKS